MFRLPPLRRQVRVLAFLTLAFLDKFAIHLAALPAPMRASSRKRSKQILGRIERGHDDLRLST
jgi:hypothetical protein